MFKKEALIEQEKISANTGENIGVELGAKFIKDYYDRYNESGSYFVGRNILEEILGQPSCIGVKIFKGLDENGKKVYVLAGVDHEGHEILKITTVAPDGSMSVNDGVVADRGKDLGWLGDLIR
jgi:hypothetical protein